jgi:hypothetical protein
VIVGTCLATPYLQDYDLVIGAFVVAWLTDRKSIPNTFRPAALIASVLLLLLPLTAAPFVKITGFSFGPLLILPAFMLTIRMIITGRSLIPARPNELFAEIRKSRFGKRDLSAGADLAY